ncbi:FKBP-type peptidyl-prolyl cis-trans isomerase SlpA [Ectothiorhodosinus mongolicus]|uniref:Peptidyl-prolyl cis-trans isomerase n=1 Tax=Ectothiorhodosinus mongolicus TaxID=233100 RepID=A0A1R3VYR5_9GAMM|nr:peptidylprolyl isomerase [Ectothiorhodosinus mongolicus]ULX57159.1 peptidylprolyl isomerase [Ectothiorhodosinus mongolicus]SIT70188.1 FKBP-type peptidyl-prolyl cis-trans isomerase SlpA [Ectothiorhodosinus mongolicus]
MITPGSRVRMHYTITLEDGRVVDDTRQPQSQAVEFVVGSGEFHECLEGLIAGLDVGMRQQTTLPPEKAFGLPSSSAIQTMPRGDFPKDMELELGMLIGFDTPTGTQIPGVIQALEADQVRVDFNHPLAGHTIVVDVEILEVKAPGE